MKTIEIPKIIEKKDINNFKSIIASKDKSSLTINDYFIVENIYDRLCKIEQIQLNPSEINSLIELLKCSLYFLPTKDKIYHQAFKKIKEFLFIINVELEVLKTDNRKRKLAEYRQMCWRYSYESINYKGITKTNFLKMLGNIFNRDRATVIYGIQQTKDIKELDRKYRINVERLNNYIEQIINEKILQN